MNGRYEEGHEFGWFMAELCMAFAEDLPDCRRQLLQTVKECFRQILKVRILAFETHGFAWLGVRSVGCRFGQMSLTEERPELIVVQLFKSSD